MVKCFPNETDRASLLRIKKEEFDASNPVYKLTINKVETFVPAKVDQILFDRAFGKDAVKSEKEFEKALEERLKSEYTQESDWRFRRDVIDYVVKKADITLPEEFLKKWLFRVNEGKFTMEQIEKEFPLFLQDYRWQMISRKVFEDQKMKIEREDLMKMAKETTARQFAMYGIPNVPEDMLNQYAEKMLNDQKEIGRLYEKCEEDKVLEYVKGVISADVKEVTRDQFASLNGVAAEKPAKKAPAKKTAKKAEKQDAAEEPKAEKPVKKRAPKAKKEE